VASQAPVSDEEEKPRVTVRSVFHTGFVVSDLDASLRFYCDGLGLVLRHRQVQHNAYTATLVGYPEAAIEIAQLKFAEGEPPSSGHILELIAYQHPPSAAADLQRSKLGSGHLAFVVDDIFSTAKDLERLGARFINPPVRIAEGINAGGWAAYLHDPDGVTLELLQPKQGATEHGA
jgi:catechol 2,3-dioxygenase-like lactoylglutathione lyase family enzyme